MTWLRTLGPLVAGLGAVAFLGGAPSAAADPTHGPAVCRSSQDAGVEVDTCTGNPQSDDDVGPPGGDVRVVPEFCIGLGFGGCDD